MKMRQQIAIIGGLLLAMFALAYVSAMVLVAKNQAPPVVQKQKCIYRLPAQVVNLSGTDGKRFLKVELVLEYETTHDERSKLTLENKKLVLIDALIMLLSNKTVSTIDGYENKEMLKDEICQKFNKILRQDKEPMTIQTVYYQIFLVQ